MRVGISSSKTSRRGTSTRASSRASRCCRREVLAIYPALPEAHVNMGYALLGAGEPGAAADFFNTATDLRPSLHNAYYGLALAERENGNDKAALAAMQAYTHLAAEDERHLPKAQEIIWELQAKTRGETP